ncbi:MAG: M23 family metallopeptidase [Spirochaetia bacterium]|jgi:murein DD-endopeptidase MepM/ murein hydrolase activator NlpD
MKSGLPRAAASVFLLLAAFPARLAWPATVELTNPATAICITDPKAVFTVEKGALRPVLGEFAIFTAGMLPLRLSTNVASGSAPGQIARLYVWSVEPLDAVSAQVSASGGNAVAEASGFRASFSGTREMWAVLLGIPAGSAPRGYTLRLSASAGPRTFLLLQPFTIQKRTFRFERISLTKELSLLLTAPDPRKTAESRSLALMLATPHPDALYETGAFLDPLPGARRTAGYGDRREYAYSDGSSSFSIHEGIDIATPTGTPVPACGRGRVVFAGQRILTGNSVVIEHLPGLFSLYYHLSALVAKQGEVVERGQIIGLSGMTGFATGPHLHWEVEASGIAVDPDALASGPLLDKSPDFIDIGSSQSTEGR